MKRVIVSGAPVYNALKRDLLKYARRIIRGANLRVGILEIVLLSDTEMRKLKHDYFPQKPHIAQKSRHTTPPDVISFPEPPERIPGPYTFIGEVYVNGDMCKKNKGELLPLFIHGFLHLLGYDHSRKKDTSEMECLERAIKNFLEGRGKRKILLKPKRLSDTIKRKRQ